MDNNSNQPNKFLNHMHIESDSKSNESNHEVQYDNMDTNVKDS